MYTHLIIEEIVSHYIALSATTANTLLQVGRLPWHGQHVQVGDACLYIHTGTHVSCTSNENTHFAVTHLLEQCFLFSIVLHLLNVGYLFTGYAVVLCQSVYNVMIGIVFLVLCWNTKFTEHKLHAFLLLHFVIRLLDVVTAIGNLTDTIIHFREHKTRTDCCFCRYSRCYKSPWEFLRVFRVNTEIATVLGLKHIHNLAVYLSHCI